MAFKGQLSIGDVAKATGVKVVTIRYYEQIGLMPAPSRTEGNYRAYSQEHIRGLRFIRRCRDLGFTLDQVRDLLRLSTQEPCTEGQTSLGQIDHRPAPSDRLLNRPSPLSRPRRTESFAPFTALDNSQKCDADLHRGVKS